MSHDNKYNPQGGQHGSDQTKTDPNKQKQQQHQQQQQKNINPSQKRDNPKDPLKK